MFTYLKYLGSKRSTHSNAYMYGFWNNKRIVLYDTLLSEQLNEELKALLDPEKTNVSKVLEEKKDSEAIEESSFNAAENNEVSKNFVEFFILFFKDKDKPNEETKERKSIGMTDDEVVAVLGHELGHWKLWHSVFNLVIMEVFKYIFNTYII